MSEYVWVSDLLQAAMTARWVDTDIVERDESRAIEALQLLKAGKSVPQDMCPKRIWGDDNPDLEGEAHLYLTEKTHVFNANGYWIVSAEVAQIMQQHDLGGGALYPVSGGVYQKDNVTRVPGEYFTWIFGNLKDAFLPDETPEKRPFGRAGIRWHLPWEQRDGSIAVSKAALAGPEVWLDEKLFKALFLSAGLGDALCAAGFKDALHLYRSRVV